MLTWWEARCNCFIAGGCHPRKSTFKDLQDDDHLNENHFHDHFHDHFYDNFHEI